MLGRLRTSTAVAASGTLLAALAGCSALPGFAATPISSVAPAPIPTAPIPTVPIPTAPIPARTIATPKPRTPAPALTTTGTAWPAILASLSGYGQWLLANPNPGLVGNVAEPGCAMSDLISRQAAGLLGDRAYLKPSPPMFATVSGPSPAPGSTAAVFGSQVTLDVTASRPPEPVVSRTGKPFMVFAALPLTALQITLYRAADNRWRFCTVETMADSGATDDPSVALI